MSEAILPDFRTQAGASLLFLREEPLRQAQDMMLLASRELAASADLVLAAHGLGRAHHRVLHFIGRSPGLSVTDLLTVLGVTKQSLSRVLIPLVTLGLVSQKPGAADRRQRRLSLTEAGLSLERALFECQRERLLAAYREAGGPAVDGFRRVMRALVGRAGRHTLDEIDAAAAARSSQKQQGSRPNG